MLSGLFPAGSALGEAVPGDDFNADTATAATVLQRWYNGRGLWDTTGWWNAANCLEALEDASIADNGQSQMNFLAKTFRRNSRENFLNEFYDDEGWWALAWIRAFDLTGQDGYLKMARTIFDDMSASWDDHCGGGIWWKKDRHYKNAIANELFLLVAIRLHQRTPGEAGANSCLDWAQREWAWFRQTGMINEQNLINDGLTRNCENNGRTVWTYNQGVILGGLTDLYKTTGDEAELKQAVAIADAAIRGLSDANGILREPCESGDCQGGDAPQFKGIFIRYLAYLNDETRKPEYAAYLRRNAHAVWAGDRDGSNHLGLKWDGPFDKADAGRHSSAMFALSAAAEPMTRNLPFAMGAGDPAFNHDAGAAAGTLAWVCDSRHAPRPGFMLSGPYLESLPRGKHTAHFRMESDRAGNATNPLVRLDVRQSDDGKILASKEVAWKDFADAKISQDFGLTFTNSRNAGPLEFRAYWNAPAQAPAVTLADVTIDGALNWTAANLAHEVGRLDGFNAWEADPVRDRASGFLVAGAETGQMRAGECIGTFELKVDNFNWDKSVVATISAVEIGSGKVVATRELKRNQFPNVLYQAFKLDFTAKPGERYEFRTFWHYAPDAPRLTQRSLVVQTEAP